jgi:cell division septation protein DedD
MPKAPPKQTPKPQYDGPDTIAIPGSESPAPASRQPFTRLIVAEENLNRGYYYVQIATMSDSRNIDALLSKYQDRYNFALVPSRVNSSAYRVLVGPLTADEYGVVLNRFQNSGYGDAFVKRIQ